jgi:TonB family protein
VVSRDGKTVSESVRVLSGRPASPAVAAGVPGGRSSGARVREARVIQRVPPVYPPLARQARVSGVVRLEATVGKDGRVVSATAVSGPPLLRQAAVEAVEQWIYEPASLNGEPVEASTKIDVAFHLTDEAAAPPGGEPESACSGGAEQTPCPIHRVAPVYPPLARQARIQGVVRLNVTVGKEGLVKSVELVSGHPLLARAAEEAVRQWVYRPRLLNGEPVEATTRTDVGFTLTTPLGLRVERSQGQLVLKWDHESDLLRDAQQANLTIIDGDHTENVPLDLRQLRAGSVVYAPMTDDVSFRMEVISQEGKRASDSVRVLPGGPDARRQ